MAGEEKGHVFWITGLPGAGKSTIGRSLFNSLKSEHSNTVYLDGDAFREILGEERGYTLEDRKQLALLYGRVCRMLASQGINVVCTTVSMFHNVRNWNRENIPSYIEIYLKVPMETLIARDQKQLYSRAMKGEIKNVVGVDIEMEEPANPDVLLINDGSITPYALFNHLVEQLSALYSSAGFTLKSQSHEN